MRLSLDLRFVFGLDSGTGEFFVENPTLVARLNLDHEKPLNVSLSVGPLGIGIVNGTIDFQAGIVFPTTGRFDPGNLTALSFKLGRWLVADA